MARPPTNFSQSDPDLVQACIAGDARAWDTLVARYARLVYAVARRHGLNTDDTADVFQDVFMIAYHQLPGLQKKQALAGWLITITQRRCWRHRGGAVYSGAPSEELAAESIDCDEQIGRWERRRTVKRALQRLPPRHRELLTALYLEEPAPSYKDLARRLGLAVGSIGPIRKRSLQRFKAILLEMGI
jgi:RNA polymerase sigma factor (sigma-70 family)